MPKKEQEDVIKQEQDLMEWKHKHGPQYKILHTHTFGH